jgi:hypothetical protein
MVDDLVNLNCGTCGRRSLVPLKALEHNGIIKCPQCVAVNQPRQTGSALSADQDDGRDRNVVLPSKPSKGLRRRRTT